MYAATLWVLYIRNEPSANAATSKSLTAAAEVDGKKLTHVHLTLGPCKK